MVGRTGYDAGAQDFLGGIFDRAAGGLVDDMKNLGQRMALGAGTGPFRQALGFGIQKGDPA